MDGTITETRQWIGIGPPPKTINVLEVSRVTAIGGYGNAGLGTATAIDAFNDPMTPCSFDWNGMGVQSTGSRLVQMDSSSGIVSLSGHLNATANVSAFPGGDYIGSCGTVSYFDWYVDSRAVTISADVDPTWHKEPLVDNNGLPILDVNGNPKYFPKQNLRASDGSMTGDIGQADVPIYSPGLSYVPSDFTAYVTYKANRATGTSWAIYQSTDAWASSLTNNSKSETLNFLYGLEIGDFISGYERPNPSSIIAYDIYGNPIYSANVPGVTGTDVVQLTYNNGTYYVPGYPNSNATGSASTDSATAIATYTMYVHHEYENPVPYKPDHNHNVEVDVYLGTPARSGVDQTFTYESEGATLAGDLLNQGQLSLLLLTAPEWVSKLFDMTELTADKLVPKSESGNTSFDATWSHPGSDWVDQGGIKTTITPPASEYGFYQMQPAILEGFVTKYVRQDHYVPAGDASGYTGFAGQKDEQTDARTGWEQGIGWTEPHFPYQWRETTFADTGQFVKLASNSVGGK